MMDLNLWTEDFFLPQEMGLDLLADQGNGQYGDLKEPGRLDGGWKLDRHEDVVEQLSELSAQSSLDDMSWMESNIDFLDTLASQPQEPSFTPDLLDIISSLPVDNGSQYPMTVFNDLLNTNTILQSSQDAVLTPPESPEQVLPVIKLEESDLRGDDHPSSPPESTTFLTQASLETETIQASVDFSCIVLPDDNVKVEFQDSPNFIGSPLSADDVESTLYSSEPATPQSPNTSTFIQSSPELYKVIATPSNISHRFSPYSKQKAESKQKSPKSKARKDSSKKLEILTETEGLDNLDKKDRKRLQNKNAAIRYRQKKKEEAKTIFSEVETLEQYNQELKTKVEDLEREVRYMKNLMQEIQKAKGLIQ